MLHSITWQSFALILLAVIAVYYLISSALFYRQDGAAMMKGWLASPWRRTVDASMSNGPKPAIIPTVMGTVSEDVYDQSEPVSIASDELIFLEDDNAIPESFAPLLRHAAPADSLVIGSVADLLHEIKTLFNMLQEYNSSKEESCSLLQSLLTKYPHLAESNFKGPITEYICELSRKGLSFELGYQEIASLWR